MQTNLCDIYKNGQDIEETEHLKLQFERSGGLLPVVVQEYATGKILMLAYVNETAVLNTIKTQIATFWSRSRKEIWIKGQTSGNTLSVKEILVDCDQDALIYVVNIDKGGVCHTKQLNGENRKTCFYRKYSFSNDKLIFINEYK